jgi:hypothetical protein
MLATRIPLASPWTGQGVDPARGQPHIVPAFERSLELMKSSPALLGPASALAVAMLLGGCVTVTPENAEDPYEGFNRSMYAFNDGLDKSIVEPVAKGYRAVTNEPVRGGVNNFLDNLGEPVTFVNEVLQGKIGNAAGTVGRFVVNTTIGIVGIFNPAEAIGIKTNARRLGRAGRSLPGPALHRAKLAA